MVIMSLFPCAFSPLESPPPLMKITLTVQTSSQRNLWANPIKQICVSLASQSQATKEPHSNLYSCFYTIETDSMWETLQPAKPLFSKHIIKTIVAIMSLPPIIPLQIDARG